MMWNNASYLNLAHHTTRSSLAYASISTCPLLNLEPETTVRLKILTKMTEHATSLWLPILSTLTTISTTAFPIHSLPSAFTNATFALQDETSALTASSMTALQRNDEISSPLIYLCQSPHFVSECIIIEDNKPQTCLNLDSTAGTAGHYARTGSVGLEVGSLRISGGVACVLFG